MKAISLKVALTKLGCTDIELHSAYMYQSGFFNMNGVLHYVNSGDVRMKRNGQLNAYYRTAKDRKDYTGGINRDFTKLVNDELDCLLTECRYKV